MSVTDELEAALASVTPKKPQDAALRALSLRYAMDLDESPSISIEGLWLIELVEGLSERPADVDRVRRFVAKVDQVAVLGLLGPKLQAALESLEMTPRARAAVRIPSGGTVPGANAGPGEVQEDDLTKQRRERASTRGPRP